MCDEVKDEVKEPKYDKNKYNQVIITLKNFFLRMLQLECRFIFPYSEFNTWLTKHETRTITLWLKITTENNVWYHPTHNHNHNHNMQILLFIAAGDKIWKISSMSFHENESRIINKQRFLFSTTSHGNNLLFL